MLGLSIAASVEFIQHVKFNHPFFKLVFIPANTTSIAQPADISWNRVIKSAFKKSFREHVCESIRSQLSQRIDPASINVDTRIMQHLKTSISQMDDRCCW